METNLQHEDLLIKLRAKLNSDKIKLWEPPYFATDSEVTQSLKDLSDKYAKELGLENDTIFQALQELQAHSVERSKANEEFKETGVAMFRVKVTKPGDKPTIIKLQKKLSILGGELVTALAEMIGVTENRVKLIFNGKVIVPTESLEAQGVKNGAMMMALVMAEAPDVVRKEDNMYLEMKTVRDDATLLSEYVDHLAEEEDDYMRLEDQNGQAVELPPPEKRALLVGLALHARGRAAAAHRDYPLALLLMLEADRYFSECRSSILKSVDNWAVLQLDVSWCYLCLRSLPHAPDVAIRLARAEAAFTETYGENHQRLIALKGTAANERLLFMRLYLMQGIVAYHQNKRAEAKALLDKAEVELNSLRVDENSVLTLLELGWSRTAARCALRACAGDLPRAQHWLSDQRAARERARDLHRAERQRRLLGVCVDGSAVSAQLVDGLVEMGYSRRLAITALRNSNNHVADAVRLIQEQPHLLTEDMSSEDDTESPSSDDSSVEPDNKLVAELEAMGYPAEQAKAALRMCWNDLSRAVDKLVAAHGVLVDARDPSDPSTSADAATERKKHKKHKKDKKKERDQALGRLKSAIRSEEHDHLDTSLVEEEEFLVQYKSLL